MILQSHNPDSGAGKYVVSFQVILWLVECTIELDG
jgi:hypothetical protein